jgi:ATP-binding cassette subfamily B protein
MIKKQVNKKKKKKTGLARLVEIAGTKKRWLFGSMILSVIATIAQFMPIICVYLIIEELAENATNLSTINYDYVFFLGFMSLAAIGATGIFHYISGMLSHVAAFNILYEIRVKLAEKLSWISMGFFTKEASGKIKKVMSEDVERIELFVAHHIPDLTSAFIFPILLICYFFYVDWRLALAALTVFPLAIIIQASYSSPETKRKVEEFQCSLEKMNATVVEYVRGMQVVKIFNQSVDAYAKLEHDIYNFRDHALGVTKNYSKTYPLYLTILSSSLLFIVPVATILLIQSPSYESFIPTVFLFFILGGGMFFPLFKLMMMSGVLMQINVGADRIDDIFINSPSMLEPENPMIPRDASIEFKNVTFSYDKNPVISNFSFVAKPNEVTALVGPSGAGKTTIGLLCARFWDVQEGEVIVGGENIRDMRTEDLMDYVSFVFQDGFMFFDTIEENIRMGNKSVTKQDILHAAKAAQCHKFIEKLPKGYDTLVGEGGTYLSGGEQQRIALARAILKNTPIVVLDEATAYADPENEGKILASFAELIKGKTVIVIAHRLSTITNADRILVIDKGTIVEQGKHDKLISNNGLYKKMWDIYSRSRTWTINIKGGLD